MISVKKVKPRFKGSSFPHQSFAESIINKYGFFKAGYVDEISLVFREEANFRSAENIGCQQLIANIQMQLHILQDNRSSLFTSGQFVLSRLREILTGTGNLALTTLTKRTSDEHPNVESLARKTVREHVASLTEVVRSRFENVRSSIFKYNLLLQTNRSTVGRTYELLELLSDLDSHASVQTKKGRRSVMQLDIFNRIFEGLGNQIRENVSNRKLSGYYGSIPAFGGKSSGVGINTSVFKLLYENRSVLSIMHLSLLSALNTYKYPGMAVHENAFIHRSSTLLKEKLESSWSSIRSFSEALQVNRRTVYRSYELLELLSSLDEQVSVQTRKGRRFVREFDIFKRVYTHWDIRSRINSASREDLHTHIRILSYSMPQLLLHLKQGLKASAGLKQHGEQELVKAGRFVSDMHYYKTQFSILDAYVIRENLAQNTIKQQTARLNEVFSTRFESIWKNVQTYSESLHVNRKVVSRSYELLELLSGLDDQVAVQTKKGRRFVREFDIFKRVYEDWDIRSRKNAVGRENLQAYMRILSYSMPQLLLHLKQGWKAAAGLKEHTGQEIVKAREFTSNINYYRKELSALEAYFIREYLLQRSVKEQNIKLNEIFREKLEAVWKNIGKYRGLVQQNRKTVNRGSELLELFDSLNEQVSFQTVKRGKFIKEFDAVKRIYDSRNINVSRIALNQNDLHAHARILRYSIPSILSYIKYHDKGFTVNKEFSEQRIVKIKEQLEHKTVRQQVVNRNHELLEALSGLDDRASVQTKSGRKFIGELDIFKRIFEFWESRGRKTAVSIHGIQAYRSVSTHADRYEYMLSSYRRHSTVWEDLTRIGSISHIMPYAYHVCQMLMLGEKLKERFGTSLMRRFIGENSSSLSTETTRKYEMELVDVSLLMSMIRHKSNEKRDMWDNTGVPPQFVSGTALDLRKPSKTAGNFMKETSTAIKSLQSEINMGKQNIQTQSVPGMELDKVVNKVYEEIEKKFKLERQRRGL